MYFYSPITRRGEYLVEIEAHAVDIDNVAKKAENFICVTIITLAPLKNLANLD